jgi:hypothetical protein
MVNKIYKRVYSTASGPGRPFAKEYNDRSVEEIVDAWRSGGDAVKRMGVDSGILYPTINYIDRDLLELDRYPADLDLSFSEDGRYCVIRRKYIPEGGTRCRYELEIKELQKEEVLTPEEEAFILKLKVFISRGGESQLCICEGDIIALETIPGCVDWGSSYYEKYPDFAKLDFGPLESFQDVRILKYTAINHWPSRFDMLIRSALYQSSTVDEAVELANSVFSKCGCGRRLTDGELIQFGIDLEWYHRMWPRVYIGEKSGVYFVYTDGCSTLCCGVTDKPEEFKDTIERAFDAASQAELFSGGGHYRCGGRPV